MFRFKQIMCNFKLSLAVAITLNHINTLLLFYNRTVLNKDLS